MFAEKETAPKRRALKTFKEKLQAQYRVKQVTYANVNEICVWDKAMEGKHV